MIQVKQSLPAVDQKWNGGELHGSHQVIHCLDRHVIQLERAPNQETQKSLGAQEREEREREAGRCTQRELPWTASLAKLP